MKEEAKLVGFRRMMFGRYKRPFVGCFEGEGSGGEGSGGEGSGGNKDGDDDKPKFSQKQVNSMVAERNKKLNAEYIKVKKELDTMLAEGTSTKEEYEAKLNELRDTMSSTEELTKRKLEKAEKDAKEKETNLVKERDAWKIRYTDATIRRSLTDAAVEHEAFNPEQVVVLLMSNTRLVEALDEAGKPTGELTPEVTLDTLNQEKKPVKLKLTPSEAVKVLKDTPDKYGNLFKGVKTGGFGGGGSGSGGGSGNNPFPKGNQDDFRAARDSRLGIKRK